jgi:signal peptide peptidase-like protein 2B
VPAYFAPAVCAYAGGLVLTYVALYNSWFGDQGQPALLYLVPCTLGTVLVLGSVRGELRMLWDGSTASGGKRRDSGQVRTPKPTRG